MKKLLSFIVAIFGMTQMGYSQNVTCADMDPICTNAGLNFTAQSNAVAASTADPSNDYGCLSSSPNPTWYYLEISQPGLLDMQLFAPQDIDFIVWGPFADLATAQANCGQMGVSAGAPEVDCSYSGTNNENIQIPNTQIGEVYVLLITNYASVVQNIDLTLNGNSTAETDCSIVTPDPCVADAGTFTYKVNGNFIQGNTAILCDGDSFEMISDGNYTLPNDTIPLPSGDGVYTATMMYLIYDAEPVGIDPNVDPGFLGFTSINTGDDYTDANNGGGFIRSNYGCGQYWVVPTPGDDGDCCGNPNNGVHWDKNGNGCYDLDTAAAFKLTLTCPITATNGINCDGTLAGNGVDFIVNGGLPAIVGGSYIITINGPGVLSAASVGVNGTITVTGLTDGDVASIIVTDANGCSQTFTASPFSAPDYTVNITPGSVCGVAQVDDGDITVTGNGGNGGAYSVSFNGAGAIVSPALLTNQFAGDAVSFVVIDGSGCAAPGDTIIGSTDHFIITTVVFANPESCVGTCDGEVQISAAPVGSTGNPDGSVITSIVWADGPTSGGPYSSPIHTFDRTGMCAGNYSVVVSDDFGCDVTVPITIGTPNAIIVTPLASNDPTCFGKNDGSINNEVNGGTPGYTISWSHDPGRDNNAAEFLVAGDYMMYATDANGCIDSLEVTLGQPDSLWFELTIKDVVCFGDSTGWAWVNPVHGAQGAVTIFWQTNNPNPVNTNPVPNLYSGTHTVQIFDDNACESEQQFVIADPLLLEIQTISSLPSYCRGRDLYPGSGTVSGTGTGGTGTINYLWVGDGNGDGVLDTATVNTWGNKVPGWYTLYVTDNVGCMTFDSVYVDSLNPIANFTVTPMDGTAPVTVTISDDSWYRTTNSWDIGYGAYNSIVLDTAINSSPRITDSTAFIQYPFDTTYTNDSTYTICLIVSNDFECYDTLCQQVTVYPVPDFVVPNVFTPNGDTHNDVFKFPSEGIETLEAVIVNRWGNEVYVFTDPNQTWDGTNKDSGSMCSDGVYTFVYKAKAFNGTEYEGNGFIHLISK